MINGLYSATSGMFVQQSHLDVIASNIANANVPGFKGERAVFRSFPDLLRVQMQPQEEQERVVGKLGGGAALDEVFTNHASGQIVNTGVDTDMAIFGPGFFHVDTPQGERLTRNGSFTKDAQGFLRTSDGNYLLGQAGRIQIVENEFFVNGEGEIFVERQRTTPIGTVETGRIRIDRLRMSQVGDPSVLEREGDSLYFLPAEAMEAIEPGDVQIGQGYLEMSNVSAIEESIRLIDNYRAYQSSQRLVQAVDETLDKVINDVGRA